MSRYYRRNNSGGFWQGLLIALLVVLVIVGVCLLLNHFVPQVNQFFTSVYDWFLNVFHIEKVNTETLLIK